MGGSTCGKHYQESDSMYKPIRSDSFAIIGQCYVSFKLMTERLINLKHL